MKFENYELWFVVGTQFLYGEDIFDTINEHATTMCKEWSKKTPCKIIAKPCVKTSDEIVKIVQEANISENCIGIITWMHTFSPSKAWIAGLNILQKPYLHVNTQFNRDIPWENIDMDFMNLNQSAHGDREHGYISARMRLKRKIIAGYWKDEEFINEMSSWIRAAIGVAESKKVRVLRLSDNMRNVAVTDGDKVEAQIKFGWQIEHYGVGDFIKVLNEVSSAEIEEQMDEYRQLYIMDTDNIQGVEYQAQIEVALKKFFKKYNFNAFHTNFEDLQELKQLPGLAAQDMMRLGYGFGAEGDWKVAALTRLMKSMSSDLDGGTVFIEDYTYHFEPGNEMQLGSHMLEVCPTCASEKPKIQVHPLSIGDREDPARLVFKASEGKAILVTIVDMGDRFRMICNDVECQKQEFDMPNLPVAGILWKPMPSLKTAAEAWIYSGGAHHSVLSYGLDAETMRDFAEMLGIEFIHIDSNTEINSLKKELYYNDIAYRIGK